MGRRAGAPGRKTCASARKSIAGALAVVYVTPRSEPTTLSISDFSSVLGPAITAALARKGYEDLTTVQQAVLAAELEGRDLRITSQTGSGKTVAIGLAIRDVALEPSPAVKGIAKPRALVVAPTRELARQVEEELTWLYAGGRGRVASTTGGASYREEHRSLAAGPTVVVGTPGRLLDHLERGAIDTTSVSAVVLDEADRMLDLGFREELESILGLLPEDHRTHLVSATFPKDVQALANRVQTEPVHVEGTRLGAANVDIEHVIHLVESRQRVDAVINLLLASPDSQTLVFVRTRADVADLAKELSEAGFGVCSLSGDMDQKARNRALASFKRGELQVLVATDVAARGIDVQDITRVIHFDVPTDADSYTHRSGRTGRAGRRGTSSLLVTPSGLGQASRLLRLAGVPHRVEPIPSARDIRDAAEQRVFDELTREDAGEPTGADERTEALARRLVEHGDPTRTIARLLGRAKYRGAAEPRDIRALSVPARPGAHPRARTADGWVPFRVTWGAEHGADTRRLLAMVCRRGNIEGKFVGPIRVERTFSVVNVSANVADAFAEAATRPDPRDRRVLISRERPPRVRHEGPPQAYGGSKRGGRGAQASGSRPRRSGHR